MRPRDFQRARRRLVERLRASGIFDARVLAAIGAVDRHLLVPEALQDQAYSDAPLLIGHGQTISAPRVVALMTQALGLFGEEKVLEVGTGSGYQAAILGRLASHVTSIERIPRLAASARIALDRLRVSNVVVHLGDGTRGRPADAPFDRIIVTAGGPDVPQPILEQLAPGGRLVGPFGDRGEQRLLCVTRESDSTFAHQILGRCDFVDLIGEHGWAG